VNKTVYLGFFLRVHSHTYPHIASWPELDSTGGDDDGVMALFVLKMAYKWTGGEKIESQTGRQVSSSGRWSSHSISLLQPDCPQRIMHIQSSSDQSRPMTSWRGEMGEKTGKIRGSERWSFYDHYLDVCLSFPRTLTSLQWRFSGHWQCALWKGRGLRSVYLMYLRVFILPI